MPLNIFRTHSTRVGNQNYPRPPEIPAIAGGGLVRLDAHQYQLPDPPTFNEEEGVFILAFGRAGYRVTQLWLQKLSQLISVSQMSRIRVLTVFLDRNADPYLIDQSNQFQVHILNTESTTNNVSREFLYKTYNEHYSKVEVTNVFANWVNLLNNHQVWIIGGIYEPITTLIPLLLTQLFNVLPENFQNQISSVNAFLSLDPILQPNAPMRVDMVATLKEINRLTFQSNYHVVKDEKLRILRSCPINQLLLFSSPDGFEQQTASTMAEDLLAKFIYRSELHTSAIVLDSTRNIGTSNTTVIETPTVEIGNLCSDKLLKELFFGSAAADFAPLFNVNNPENGQFVSTQLPKELFQNPLIGQLLTTSQNQFLDLMDEDIQGYSKLFQWGIGKFIFDNLNDSDYGISFVIPYLHWLNNRFSEIEPRVGKMSLLKLLKNFKQTIKSGIEALQDWKEQSKLSPDHQSLSSSLDNVILKDQVCFDELQNGKVCRSVNTIDLNAFYDRFISIEKNDNQLVKARMEKIRERFGWWVKLDDEQFNLDITLYCVPFSVAVQSRNDLMKYIFPVSNISGLIATAKELSKEFVNNIILSNLHSVIEELQENELQFLFSATQPTLTMDNANLVPEVVIFGPSNSLISKVRGFNGFLAVPNHKIQLLPPNSLANNRVGVYCRWENIPWTAIPSLSKPLADYYATQNERGHVQDLEKNAIKIERLINWHLTNQGRVSQKTDLHLEFVILGQNLNGINRFIRAWQAKIIKRSQNNQLKEFWVLDIEDPSYDLIQLADYDETHAAESLLRALKAFCLELPNSEINDPRNPFYRTNVEQFFEKLDNKIQTTQFGNVAKLLAELTTEKADTCLLQFIDLVGAILNNGEIYPLH